MWCWWDFSKKFTRIRCLSATGRIFTENITDRDFTKPSLKTIPRILIYLVKSQVPVSAILKVNTVWKQQLLFNRMFSRNQKCFSSTADVQFLSACHWFSTSHKIISLCCLFLCKSLSFRAVWLCFFFSSFFYSLTGNASCRESVSNVFNQLWENV